MGKKFMNALAKILSSDQLKELVGAKGAKGGEGVSEGGDNGGDADGGSGPDDTDAAGSGSGSGAGEDSGSPFRSLTSDTQSPEPEDNEEEDNQDTQDEEGGNGLGDLLGNDAEKGLPGANPPRVNSDKPLPDLGAINDLLGSKGMAQSGGPNDMTQESKKPTGLPREDVQEMLRLLKKAANHRKIAEEQLLLVGNIFASNGFVGKNRPQKSAMKVI